MNLISTLSNFVLASFVSACERLTKDGEVVSERHMA